MNEKIEQIKTYNELTLIQLQSVKSYLENPSDLNISSASRILNRIIENQEILKGFLSLKY